MKVSTKLRLTPELKKRVEDRAWNVSQFVIETVEKFVKSKEPLELPKRTMQIKETGVRIEESLYKAFKEKVGPDVSLDAAMRFLLTKRLDEEEALLKKVLDDLNNVKKPS